MCRKAKSWGWWPDTSPSQAPGHLGLTKVKYTWTQIENEPDFSPVGVLLWRVSSRRWTQTSKTTRDSAIKTPGLLLCLAFQFKWFYGRPDTISQFPEWHPFVFFFSFVRQRSGQKAQRKWSVLLESPDGDAQDSRSFGDILCFYLGTFRPLLFCLASPKVEEAIKPTARYKHSSRPEAIGYKMRLKNKSTSGPCSSA